MNPGLPLHARVRIRLRHCTKPKHHLLEYILNELQKAGLYSWHAYHMQRPYSSSYPEEWWFSARQVRGLIAAGMIKA